MFMIYRPFSRPMQRTSLAQMLALSANQYFRCLPDTRPAGSNTLHSRHAQGLRSV